MVSSQLSLNMSWNSKRCLSPTLFPPLWVSVQISLALHHQRIWDSALGWSPDVSVLRKLPKPFWWVKTKAQNACALTRCNSLKISEVQSWETCIVKMAPKLLWCMLSSKKCMPHLTGISFHTTRGYNRATIYTKWIFEYTQTLLISAAKLSLAFQFA